MQQVVSITKQGQLTIPKSIINSLGIKTGTKATIKTIGKTIVVKPKTSFASLAGSLKSSISLTDRKLRQARNKFPLGWATK